MLRYSRNCPSIQSRISRDRAPDHDLDGAACALGFPTNDLTNFIAYAKTKPQGLNAARLGRHDRVDRQAEVSRRFQYLDVPYKGVPLAIADVLGGQLDFTFGDFAVSVPQIRAAR